MITYVAPASLIIAAEISPVNAPSLLPVEVLRGHVDVAVARRLAAACSAVNGGADDDLRRRSRP